MKKLLVLSDTHGNKSVIAKLKPLMEECDYVLHLGDHYYDLKEYLPQMSEKIYTVFGNCDGGGEDYELNVNGVRILMTHGDRYHVKLSLLRLSLRAQEIGANLVLYGHTHVAKIEEENGITFLNPGCMTAFSPRKSYAVIEIEDSGKIKAEIKEISK